MNEYKKNKQHHLIEDEYIPTSTNTKPLTMILFQDMPLILSIWDSVLKTKAALYSSLLL